MFCRNCGANIGDSKFCPECGTPSGSEVSRAVEPVVAVQPEPKLQRVKVCPNCAALNSDDATACAKCHVTLEYSKVYDAEIDAKKIEKEVTTAEMRREYRAMKAEREHRQPEPYVRNPSKKEVAKQRIQENKSNGVACCPKCGSTSLSANKKGFGIGKAVIGASIAPIGLVAGNINAKKLWVTCLNCGHRWKV